MVHTIKSHDSIEYRDTFSPYVLWHKISGIAQHYLTQWFMGSFLALLPCFVTFDLEEIDVLLQGLLLLSSTSRPK